jgi:hypothetical protein
MIHSRRGWLSLTLLLVCDPSFAQVMIGKFSSTKPEIPAPWQLIRLETQVPATSYRISLWDGVDAVEARAERSMALLGRPVDIDLAVTPVLCWRWRVDGVVRSADMTRRRGDDYAARIYLAFDLPSTALSLTDKASLTLARAFYGSRVPDGAINYVWDNRHPVGMHMPNAYTDRVRMIVQRSGNDEAGFWVTERVNIHHDVKRSFGTSEARLKLVAVASDSDNTGETVHAGFADLHFVRATDACQFESLKSGVALDQSASPRHSE